MDINTNINNIATTLGDTIQNERKIQRLTQSKLADGICSQSMISSIEKGDYIPNAILLSQICSKLNISVDNALLMNYLEIDQLNSFNKYVKKLCKAHQYEELLDYMNESDALNLIIRNEDFQTYYYYYGVATYQATSNVTLAKRYIQMALDYTYVSEVKNIYVTPTELLLFSSLGIAYTDLNKPDLALNYFDKAINYITNNKITHYDENINSIFYQYSYSLMKMNNVENAISTIISGVNFAKSFDSHYMISNMFFLLHKCYKLINNNELANDALNSHNVMDKLFKNPIYKEVK